MDSFDSANCINFIKVIIHIRDWRRENKAFAQSHRRKSDNPKTTFTRSEKSRDQAA